MELIEQFADFIQNRLKKGTNNLVLADGVSLTEFQVECVYDGNIAKVDFPEVPKSPIIVKFIMRERYWVIHVKRWNTIEAFVDLDSIRSIKFTYETIDSGFGFRGSLGDKTLLYRVLNTKMSE